MRRGAALSFPSEASNLMGSIKTLVIEEGSSMLQGDLGHRHLRAETLDVREDSLLGCVTCALSEELQNMAPGCAHGLGAARECAKFNVTAYEVRVGTGGRIVGITVGITVNGSIEVGPEGGIVPGDATVDGFVTLDAKNVNVMGLVKASSIVVVAAQRLVVSFGGNLTASGMGYKTGAGPGAGLSSPFGGGGGGNRGRGDDACSKKVSGEAQARGGGKVVGLNNASGGWEFGSGGGAGNPIAEQLAVMGDEGRLTYPMGGPESCVFDRSCADLNAADRLDMGRKQEVYQRVYQVVRLNGAVRSGLALCYPRGQAVDAWSGTSVLSASSVPPHPRACAAGWVGSSLRDYCCSLEGSQDTGDGVPLWAGGGSACDCITADIGTNPGGRGGGRVSVRAGVEVVVDGGIAADGEHALCFGANSNSGGGGAGGSVEITAPVVRGGGRVAANGGSSRKGCVGADSGGGGGGGLVDARFGVWDSSVALEASGGDSECDDDRIGRFCPDLVYRGECEYLVMGDEFDDVDLGNPFWKWANVPPGDCSQGSPEIAPNFRRRLVASNPHQGRCWDVGMSRNGWMRIIPSHGIQMWNKDTAHRLFYELPSRVAFDVETRIQFRNNGTSCLSAGMFVR